MSGGGRHPTAETENDTTGDSLLIILFNFKVMLVLTREIQVTYWVKSELVKIKKN